MSSYISNIAFTTGKRARVHPGMKAVAHRLSKVKPRTFRVSYSPTYTNFVPNFIASNPAHPLFITQRRRQQERKKEGLWWHATNGVDISKSGCVRTWARRRLRQAFVDELKQKGYDETGKLVDASAMQERADVMNVVRLGRSVDLTGSLRMHGDKSLVPAKFDMVKEEVRSVIDTLIQGAVDTALGFAGEGERSGGLGHRPARMRASSQPKGPQERIPVAALPTPKKKLDITTKPSRVKLQTASTRAPLRTQRPVAGAKDHAAPPRPAMNLDRGTGRRANPSTARQSQQRMSVE